MESNTCNKLLKKTKEINEKKPNQWYDQESLRTDLPTTVLPCDLGASSQDCCY